MKSVTVTNPKTAFKLSKPNILDIESVTIEHPKTTPNYQSL